MSAAPAPRSPRAAGHGFAAVMSGPAEAVRLAWQGRLIDRPHPDDVILLDAFRRKRERELGRPL